MRLTKYQKARCVEFGWDVVETDVNGEVQNCSWISLSPEDGTVFQEACDVFGLTGEHKDIKLLVVATQEGDE
jgi:hypothetical protein